MSSTTDLVQELTGGMLRKTLYAVLSRGSGRDFRPYLPAHIQYMIELERQGRVFASGPFDGGATGDGLTILYASGKEEAEAVASRDPLVVNGFRTFEVREWLVMEGSIGVRLNYSDGRFELT